MLLSRSPLASCRSRVPLDLHVLGAPPAFILSQDRTLRPSDFCESARSGVTVPGRHDADLDPSDCVAFLNFLER